ncbi:family 16 glycosylhydrolase [Streptomyces sp. NPDC094447]|uniref:family 16 glycosylhydrolase n=1 Tax=Streptomyces sp. NPDC094447 TaxID=3366062 RepID=UPI00381CA44B
MRPVRAAILAASLLATTALLIPSAQADNSTTPAGSGYKLVFADEFNGSSVDTSTWNFRTDRKALSAQLPENVTQEDGVLSLNLRKQQVDKFAYTGGGVVSKRSFRYGYYETRAKLPHAPGWHTSFWMQRGDGSNTYNPERRTEIDQFEIEKPNDVSQGVIAWQPNGSQEWYGRKHTDPGFDNTAGWHTYGMDWNEQQVRFYIDGKLTNTVDYPTTATTHDYVNIWLTSIAYIAPVDESALPAKAQFDYVRYYQRDAYVDNDTPANYGYRESGTWQDSSLTGFTDENKTRYSTAPGASVTWKPNLPNPGNYDVYVYKVARPENDPGATLTVTHDGQTSKVPVDYTTGQSGWVKLGNYRFSRTDSGSVTLDRSSGIARADAVKFIRTDG